MAGNEVEFQERVVRHERPERHFVYLIAPDGSMLGMDGDGELARYEDGDDRVIWDRTPGGVTHVVTGRSITAEVSMDGHTLDMGPERGALRIGHGPERLPSDYLEDLKRQGWVCLTCLLPAEVVDGLQRVACTDRYEGQAFDGEGPKVCWHSAVGKAISEPVSLWLIRQFGRVLARDYAYGDVSVARRWNEVLLAAIRNDFARPTVHARNLFHVSAAMYDAWAAYAEFESRWLLGRERAGTECTFDSLPTAADAEDARNEAMSHAAYRLILHRFADSPGTKQIQRDADALMGYQGFDPAFASTDYATADDPPAALGNHIAACYIAFGLEDGANEANGYANQAYEPVNPALEPAKPGNPDIVDRNRWQPLKLEVAIDQAGNPVDSEPAFIGPEWGSVVPFALREEDLTTYQRDGWEYRVYHDPGPPPTWDGSLARQYEWNFALVAAWASHLSSDDGVTMDISPASIGNIDDADCPTQFEDYETFYDFTDGGDPGEGYDVNPATGEPYAAQVVPRGDYTRVLAEFWADGPDSETPPGHWFVIANEVTDHPSLDRRYRGSGAELHRLEWDAKLYFVLGGAMHDVAVTAWGIKGYYDYIRPISAIRAMTDLGQSSDSDLPSYHVDGITLRDGLIELVDEDDPLAGDDGQHVDKIKLYTWLGHDFVEDPDTEVAGVGWILAENWWPYQRPTFVTPPFAGYVSGHSTYSRAAAEVLTAFTGDEYFPGGKSSFEIRRNDFLVFEEGPSVDMRLEWARYRDASDQCSLSRIWGGIHPPADDIPGRLIGIDVGLDAFELADRFFSGEAD